MRNGYLSSGTGCGNIGARGQGTPSPATYLSGRCLLLLAFCHLTRHLTAAGPNTGSKGRPWVDCGHGHHVGSHS